jgi:cytochrome c peroxidase
LLDGKPLQTPNLAGRSDYHGAIRWAANSPDLEHSVAEAIKRLQGSGLPPADMKALAAFIRSGKHEMRAPDNPHERQARGAALFASAGCDACHDPAQSYSDGKLHAFRGGQFRTPSLAGLFLTAPYFHDGSASSLGVLLAAHEKGNPMAQGSMSKDDRAALEAFLLSL